METLTMPNAALPEPPVLDSPFKALGAVLFSPFETFRAVRKGVGPIVPLVVGAALMALFSYLSIQPILDVMSRDPSLKLSATELASVTQTLRATRLLLVALVPAGFVLRVLVVAAILWSVLQLGDVEVRFSSLFSAVAYTAPVKCLQAAFVAFVTARRAEWATSVRDLAPKSGLNLLFNDLSRPLDALLESVNVFEVWSLALLAVSVIVLTGVSRGRAVRAVLPVWLLFTLFTVGVAFLG